MTENISNLVNSNKEFEKVYKQLQDDKDKGNKVQKYIAKQVTKGIEQVEQKIRDDLDLLDDEFINQ